MQSPPAPAQLQQQQQLFNSITARLTQLAKDPPDLPVYLRAHAECVTTAFRPVGFAYDMISGPAFHRVLQGNVESLGLKEAPEQDNAFQRARRLAADQRKPVVLPPHSQHGTPSQIGIPVAESPAPDESPVFNRTPFEQLFVPIPQGNASAGVLHIWFQPGNPNASHARLMLLRQLCNEIELYLKTRRARDASQEVTRISTYARLLEELTGDIDVDSVCWKLVNYAREAVACDRVCLFTVAHYDRVHDIGADMFDLSYDFKLQACSGLKRPHPKSEQAGVLQRVAQKLAEMSLAKSAAESDNGPAPLAEAPTAAAAPAGAAPVPERPPGPAAPARQAGPIKPKLTLMMRDPSKIDARPVEVNDYFEVMPMNWATVIPLFDRDQRVCGILLFEGTKLEEQIAALLKPMLDLAASAGKALGTALYCNQHRSMRIARRLVATRQAYVNTPTKRKWLRFGLPALLFVAVLACPIPYSVKGGASVLPVTQTTLPALVSSRLLEVPVREGESVTQGQVLARFDTRDIQLQLVQAEQEYERSLVESDAAMNAGNEAQMQIARLNADKAAAMAEKLRLDLSRAVVRAPFDGIVLGAQTLSTRVGEVLRLGEPALHVVDPRTWQVKAVLKERDLIFLEKRLKTHGPVPAALRLAANPAHKYQLQLVNRSQLAYGLDTSTGDYQFTVVVPLNAKLDDAAFLKSGFTGRMTFESGVRPVAYVLFKDFVDFLTVRFF
ncbi:efflux RND transporter periplasmic adaptor subunit [Opitutus terrae]|uniref:efflux RND transporter periplasmic adaptor subunit n=1 Tax=Opitutus terrae TaxID=107709 RepID=UPI0003108544|nr:HlyD family efflux transporter periplasmic adaptor subunit [Opitutus terrae]